MPFKWKVHTKVIKMPSLKAWVQRPSDVIKWREVQELLFREGREVGIQTIIHNQS